MISYDTFPPEVLEVQNFTRTSQTEKRGESASAVSDTKKKFLCLVMCHPIAQCWWSSPVCKRQGSEFSYIHCFYFFFFSCFVLLLLQLLVSHNGFEQTHYVWVWFHFKVILNPWLQKTEVPTWFYLEVLLQHSLTTEWINRAAW